MFETPILFIIFNRPETTETVFEQIKKIKPKYLYVAADGPRLDKEGETELCNKTRAIIKDINWSCEVKTLFREKNLGCGTAVSEAITWFFDNVEQGIILEDDCLPDLSFFIFCETLLEKYKDDERVSTIGATNYQLENNTDKSYYFSIYSHVWGWATWRRTWNLYNYTITDYKKGIIDRNFKTQKERNYWHSIFSNTKRITTLNTWDYQLQYLNFKNNMISIISSVCLVKNIGHYNGTHILEEVPSFHAKLRYGEIEEINYPKNAERDFKADLYFYKNILALDEPNFAQKTKRKMYIIYQWLFK